MLYLLIPIIILAAIVLVKRVNKASNRQLNERFKQVSKLDTWYYKNGELIKFLR